MAILYLSDEKTTLQFGQKLSGLVPSEFIVYLHGPLGAGKTTLVRGFLRALGYEGAVKSPTYTLVEPYEIDHRQIYHFDLFRLTDSEELDYIGMRDYSHSAICFIEWPEKGESRLPPADLHIYIAIQGAGRSIEIEASSQSGSAVLAKLLK